MILYLIICLTFDANLLHNYFTTDIKLILNNK